MLNHTRYGFITLRKQLYHTVKTINMSHDTIDNCIPLSLWNTVISPSRAFVLHTYYLVFETLDAVAKQSKRAAEF